MFNSFTRENHLRDSEQQEFDLLIVGGGITGAGVARDAASRGLKVFLCEAQDFASGTSSRSSKLVHGGIRYLENLEFGLVHEALTERKNLLRMAPHMVHPLRFMIPIYKTSRVGLFKMEAGMILYDLLSFFEAPEIHEMHRAQSTLRKEPLIKAQELSGSVIYSDAYMEDDRLVIETLRSAEAMGAKAVNYAKVEKIENTQQGIVAAVSDLRSSKKYSIRAKHIVGCVGPWTDIFAQHNVPAWKPVLRPTKGVHIVFERSRVPVQQAVVMAVEERIVFVIPREEIVIVGTTDTDFKQDPSCVDVDTADVKYLLEVTNKYFPELSLKITDVISCYSGVRPLVQDGSNSEGKTSREHEIFEVDQRTTLVAGGKYTTYRAMAEDIVESVLRGFSFEKKMALRSPNTLEPLNSGATVEKIDRLLAQAANIAQDYNVSTKLLTYIVKRRGEEAFTVLHLMKLLSEKNEQTRFWMAEAKFCIENEMCLNLVDFYTRRSPLFLFHRDHGLTHLPQIASTFAKALNWSDTEVQAQIKSLHEFIQMELKSLPVTSASH